MKCYNFNKVGHPSYRCPNKTLGSYGEKKIAYVQEEDNHKQGEVDLDLEKGSC